MDRNKGQDGFSILELAIAMSIVAMLSMTMAPALVQMVQIKAAEKTALEINLIQDAARNYYALNKQWPTTIQQLKDTAYLDSNWSIKNPWDNEYRIDVKSSLLMVSTKSPPEWTKLIAAHVPAATINNDIILSTIPGPNNRSSIEKGVIVAWSGAIADIPQGWQLCDGTQGTPDLRDKFIIGASVDDNKITQTTIFGDQQKTGGSIIHNHFGETAMHQLTVEEMPTHSHDTFDCSSPFAGCYVDFQGAGAWKGLAGGGTGRGLVRYRTGVAGDNQPHSHFIASDNHIPPFYALAFIMKII